MENPARKCDENEADSPKLVVKRESRQTQYIMLLLEIVSSLFFEVRK
jgi:hypothetical protein